MNKVATNILDHVFLNICIYSGYETKNEITGIKSIPHTPAYLDSL